MDDVVFCVMFFVTEWLNEIPLMDLHDNLALVSILQRVFPYLERWRQRLHACGTLKTNLKSSGLDFAVLQIASFTGKYPKREQHSSNFAHKLRMMWPEYLFVLD